MLLAMQMSVAPRSQAHATWLRAADQEALLRTDAALHLYRRATREDPQFLPAHLDYMVLMRTIGRNLELRAQYDSGRYTGEFGECLATLAWGLSGHDLPEVQARYRALTRRYGHTPCTAVAWTWGNTNDKESGDAPELIATAIERYGNSPLLTMVLSEALRRTGRRDSGFQIARDAEAQSGNRTIAMKYRFELVRQLNDAGHHKLRALELERATRMADRDGRPLFQLMVHLERLDYRRHRELGKAYRVPWIELDALDRLGHAQIDQGDLQGAISTLTEAVAIAEATNGTEFRLRSYLLRGRALAAQGKKDSAIADLRRAAKAARILGERYRLADSYHQMAHAYESKAQWREAIAAADSFVKIGANVRDTAMRMIRLNDAATIQWKAGYHARAEAVYEEMVRTIERDRGHYEYAGAYFERSGNLSRAKEFYAKAYDGSRSSSAKLALAGLTRVYQTLGLFDSAIVTARKHDSLLVTPEREILLPRLLFRLGDSRAAILSAREWLDIQLKRGNTLGVASALNQLAELTLPSDPKGAVLLALRSDSVAASVNANADRAVAARLRGIAKGQMGNVGEAIHDLEAALRFSRAVHETFLPITIMTDAGDLLHRAARPAQALRWYARADDRLRAVTSSYDDPVILAKLRDARSALFDGALRTVLSLPTEARTLGLLEWSERKKGRSSWSGARAGPAVMPNAAIVDYLTVADSIVANVLTRRGAHQIVLPVSVQAIARMSEVLVHPLRATYGGRVDLSRAPYSLTVAHVLYNALLKPLEPTLEGVETITLVLDVPLQRVPFDALVARPGPGGQENDKYVEATFAADIWTLILAPTVYTAGNSASRAAYRQSGMLVVGHDGPGVAREVLSVSASWPKGRTRLLSGHTASESAVRTAPAEQILHFAAHALSDDNDPLRSHLKLEADGKNDGVLHASEVRQMRIPNSLVFLSACETATGPMFRGTGTLSLGRAFLDAGASYVISTQWPVGSVSGEIASGFYRSIAKGSPPSRALYEAKLAIRRDLRTAHPFYWASHILLSR